MKIIKIKLEIVKIFHFSACVKSPQKRVIKKKKKNKKEKKNKLLFPPVDASAGAALHTHTYILSRPVINPPKFPVIIWKERN